MKSETNIIFCKCKYSQIIDETKKAQILNWLKGNCANFQTTDDLCGLCANQKQLVKDITNNKDITIIACFERAVKALLEFAGSTPEDLAVLNMRNQSSDEIIQIVKSLKTQPGESVNHAVDDSWAPWYPTIEKQKCTNCGKCHDFCLFGVYSKTDNGITVTKPDACKNNCPACARLCPSNAIIFPKAPDEQINGAQIDPNKKTTTEEILTGDVLENLKNRTNNTQRFAPGTDNRLTSIPQDVINNLTPEEIAKIKEKCKEQINKNP